MTRFWTISAPLLYRIHLICFREEKAGSAKFSRGIIRVHQFDKVGNGQVAKPEGFHESAWSPVQEAERRSFLLGLPYHVVTLSALVTWLLCMQVL